MLFRSWNRFHVAAWVAVVLLSSSAATKGMLYDGEMNARIGVAFTFVDHDGHATCAANPVHCKPFSFLDEVAMWRRGWTPLPRPPSSPSVAPAR